MFKKLNLKFTPREVMMLSIIGSITFHLGVWMSLLFHKGFKVPNRPQKIEITVIEKAAPVLKAEVKPPPPPPPMIQKPTQVVEQEVKQPTPQQQNTNAKFLSAHNNKVAKETHAKAMGKFKNAELKKAEVETQEKSDVTEQQANSQSDDYLKDVASGMQTMLNTQEFAYYNYYKTIKDKVQHHWEPLVGQKVKFFSNSGRDLASSSERKTRMLIILDKNGDISNIEVVGGSGIKDADNAVIEAFKKASPFGAPPKGLISANGEVRLRWDFVLEQD